MHSECDSWNQNKRGRFRTTGCGHHDRHIVPGPVPTDTDLGECFPSAHGPKDRLADLHVPLAISKQPLDLVIDLLLEMQVSGRVHVDVGMSQYTGQFIPADLELVIAEHLTKDLVTLGIIGPRRRVKAESESFARLDDLVPSGRWRMLGLIDDDEVLTGEIYGFMGATNLDPRSINAHGIQRSDRLLTGLTGRSQPSEGPLGPSSKVLDDGGSDEGLTATGWRDDESISTRCGPLDCSLLVRAEQKSLRRFNFRMIFGLHSVRCDYVCLGLVYPRELHLPGAFVLISDGVEIHRHLLHATNSEGSLFRPELVGVPFLLDHDHEGQTYESLKEPEESPADAKIELVSICDVGFGSTDECLEPPHHRVLENEPVTDDLTGWPLVTEGCDGVTVLIETVVLAGIDGDGVFAGAGERFNFCGCAINFKCHVSISLFVCLFGLTSRPRGQRECLGG